MANEVALSELTREMASIYKVDPGELIKTVKSVCFNGAASDEQLFVFLSVARNLELSPFQREIYAFVSSGKLQTIVGFDGWIKIVNRNPAFAGFEFRYNFGKDGKLESVTCRMYRRDWAHYGEATEYLTECKGATDPWNKWPARMLRNKAYIQCARMTFGFAGIIDPDENERIVDGAKWANVDTATGEVVGAIPPREVAAEVVENPQNGSGPQEAAATPPESPPAESSPPNAPAGDTAQPRRGRPRSARKHLLELAKGLPPARLTVMLGQEGLTKLDDATDEQAERMVAKLERKAK